jgi:hypothetical protein
MLVNNPGGNYLFAPGGEAFSDGVVSAPGYEIVRVTLKELLPWRQGFDLIDAFLKEQGRPRQALCAVELRCARPFTAEGFSEFNQGYRSLVADWRILVDGVNPMARTNVAPVVGPPAEASLFAFAFTAPAPGLQRPTFVAAGAGEITASPDGGSTIVRRGDTSPEAIREKNAAVMQILDQRLVDLEKDWSLVTGVTVYTVYDIHPFIEEEIHSRMGAASLRGLVWHYARPPIVDIDYEMDLRGHAREIFL